MLLLCLPENLTTYIVIPQPDTWALIRYTDYNYKSIFPIYEELYWLYIKNLPQYQTLKQYLKKKQSELLHNPIGKIAEQFIFGSYGPVSVGTLEN